MSKSCLVNAIWLLCVCVFIVPVGGMAQNLNASISSIVLDPSGAAIPNATLTFTNVATHASRKSATNLAGHYLIAGPVSALMMLPSKREDSKSGAKKASFKGSAARRGQGARRLGVRRNHYGRKPACP